MFKMTVTYEQLSYLLAIIKADINNDRENDLEPCEAAFELEAKLVASGQVRDADLHEANAGELCSACGRDGLDCSRDPCAAVIADRAA